MDQLAELPERKFLYHGLLEIQYAAKRGEWTIGADDVIHEMIRRDYDLEQLLGNVALEAHIRGIKQDPEIYREARGVFLDGAWREGKYGDSRYGLARVYEN